MVYPNPFEDYFVIESQMDDIVVIQTIEGKIILEQNIQTGMSKIATESLSEGLYVVKLINQRIKTKLVKL